MTFESWLKKWLGAHPLKESPSADRSRYTAQVMARVRGPAPTPTLSALRSWNKLVWGWPRLALVGASIAAGLVLAVGIRQQRQLQVAKAVEQEAQLLAELGEPIALPIENGESVDTLAHELETDDLLVLAEAPPSDDQWLAETLQLLEEIDEELPEGSSDEASSDDWLQELEMLDETELATRT